MHRSQYCQRRTMEQQRLAVPLANLCCVNIPRSRHGRQTVGFQSHFAIGPRSGERGDPALGRPQVSRDSGETCGPAKRRGRETRAERGSPTARRQRADAQRLDSGERLAAGEVSAIAVRRDDD